MDVAALVKKAKRFIKTGKLSSGQPYARGIVFVHVPKCGGTSVGRALRPAFVRSRMRINAESSTAAVSAINAAETLTVRDVLIRSTRINTAVLQYALGNGAQCITGHAPLTPGLIDAYSGSHDFVTILRDPVDRFKSSYTYAHKSGRYGNVDEDIEAFLETARARDFGSLFIKYYGLVDFYGDYDADEAVASAKATLSQMSAVGFVDRMEDFSNQLCALTGKDLKIGHENRGASKAHKSRVFAPEIEARIAQLCARDMEIYNWAREAFAAEGTKPE